MSGLRAGALRSHVQGPAHALALVAAEVAAAEAELPRLLSSDAEALPAVSDYLLHAGGKRLRPALTALGALAVGGAADLPRLMCCGELIHLGSLLHDDVVDAALTRRGRPAASLAYGNAVSVLTGDFCVARALVTAAEVGGVQAGLALARTVAAMAEGEVWQLQHAGDLSLTYERYLAIIERKSAVLISWCAAAAAWQREDAVSAAALQSYGRLVGLAFQITDDVLDYRPRTGKERGADLRERKVTLPLLVALGRVPGLAATLEAGAPTPEELPELMATVAASGALESALGTAREFVERALVALETLPDNEGRHGLAALASHLVERAS